MKREVVIRCKGARLLAIDDMYPIQGNLKDLSEARYKKLKKEILELGYSEPISVWFDKKTKRWCILNGTQRHRTLRMMRDEGYKIPLIPVAEIQADSLDEARRKILALTSQYGEMTEEGLYEFLHEANIPIAEVEASFEFAEIDMEHFKASYYEELAGGVVEDEVPKTRKTNIKLGDLYQLGSHRLLCGDSTNVVQLERLMNKESADMVFTDPPYRMEAEGGSNQTVGKAARKLGERIKHLCDFDPVKFLENLPTAFQKDKMNAYIFCNKDLVPDYLNWGVENGYSFNILFWKKPNAIPLGGSHRPDVEYLLLFRKSAIWNNAVPNVVYSKCLEFQRELSEDHPTIKPIGLITNEIQISSNKGGLVVDMFLGSGSTLIACEHTARRCFGMELDPQYCQVIIDRWEKLTSLKAIKIK